jgi:hypothetical protein
MKLSILLITSFAFISTNGQNFSRKVYNVIIYNDSLLIPRNPSVDALAINQKNYRFLFKNEKGSVYESPIDNMRCLAPDFHSKMPVADLPKMDKNGKKNQPEPMPNPLQDRESIPPPLPLKK